MLMLTAQIFQTENLTQPWEDPDYCLKHQIKKVECNYSFSTKSDSSRIFRKDSEIYEIDERGRFTAQLYFFGGVISNAWRIVYDSTLSPASTYTYYFGALKTEAEKVSPQLTVKKTAYHRVYYSS